jgi:hypothetical protein
MQPTGYESNVPQAGLEEHAGRMDAVKQKLGQVGRKLKRIEVREQIVAHPFAAIGIGAAVGALIGLARPMPERSRTSAAVSAALTAIAIRFVREAAFRKLGGMAKDWLQGQQSGEPQYSPAYGDR